VQWDPAAVWGQIARELDLPDDLPTLHLPPQPPQHAGWPAWVPQPVRAALGTVGIESPFAHQVAAAEAVWNGGDVAVATGTATGKSLAYLLPMLAAIGEGEAMPATSLYLAPTKALAHDQLRRLALMDLPGLRPAAYDGDTAPEERRWARRHATVVVSNPDMLHAGILPNHAAWQSFLKRLRFIVVDEFHVYRGLFGANLAAVLRRLLRLVEHYGGDPSIIGTSATVDDPEGTLGTLTGRPATPIATAAALNRAETHLVLVPADGTGLLGRTAALLAALVARDTATLAFVRSRRGAEVVSMLAQDRLQETGREARVAPYRSGYLPEERRALERGLREGSTVGMAATSALELGIDISGLDSVVVAGWPGTRAALRQRLGRAGRSGRPALAVFLADDNPLDAHLVRHPRQIVDGLEGLVIDAENPYVLGPHLCAAAAELPLTDGESTAVFGAAATGLLPVLADRGLLRRRPSGWYWTRTDRASDLADLRGSTGAPVAVVEEGTGRLIGTVDRGSADRTVHCGAVYSHRGEDYLISDLDLEEGVATAQRATLPYSTHAQSVHDIRLLQPLRSTSWDRVGVGYGVAEVSARVTSFLKRRVRTGEVIGQEPLELPQRTLRTKAVWWSIPDELLQDAGIQPSAVAGAAHAAEHAAIGMLPLFAHCDRWDIGGVSTPNHPDTGTATIVVHDGLPGGAGFAERGFAAAVPWWTATLRTVSDCPCDNGCPGCVQSPKCGNGNEPLDKPAAIALLRAVLAGSPGWAG
jgi:DEAD/DEAH box helicase domain-containing protein